MLWAYGSLTELPVPVIADMLGRARVDLPVTRLVENTERCVQTLRSAPEIRNRRQGLAIARSTAGRLRLS